MLYGEYPGNGVHIGGMFIPLIVLLPSPSSSPLLARQTSSKRKKEQERSLALIEKLQEEKQRQEDNHRLVNSCIKQEKDSWFTASELSCDCHMIPFLSFNILLTVTDSELSLMSCDRCVLFVL